MFHYQSYLNIYQIDYQVAVYNLLQSLLAAESIYVISLCMSNFHDILNILYCLASAL